ncbi:hypothetical protein RIF29_25597 [Crotalaria pallida]|uniref:SAM-dependent MTase RsmB/NOP-type domain-containing protein n=1 Tax=Crotalaria pallida TaxID=3830 RepID=A0AAN9HZX5_CROPI
MLVQKQNRVSVPLLFSLPWKQLEEGYLKAPEHQGLSLLKVDEKMVYSTCSMNPMENEVVVAEMLENLVIALPTESQKPALEDKSHNTKRPAPSSGGCRIEGYVRVKKVPGNLIISARSDAHSFDASQMNMSHVVHHLFFGRKISAMTMNDVKRSCPILSNNPSSCSMSQLRKLPKHYLANRHPFFKMEKTNLYSS